MSALAEALQPWNTHWGTSSVSPLVLKTERERAAVPYLVQAVLGPGSEEWTLLAGPRQIGKTTSLGHVARRLLVEHGVAPRQVVIMPLDQPALQQAMPEGLDGAIAELGALHPPSRERPLILLLDEVQEMPGWAKMLKAAWDRHHSVVRVLATGSSAMQMIHPADADFPGRVRIRTLHPMKFREVVLAHPAAAEHATPAQLAELESLARTVRACIARRRPDGELFEAMERLHAFTIEASPTLRGFLRHVFAEHCVWGGYPRARAGANTDAARRREVFEQSWNAILAKDASSVGLVKTREFGLLFQHIARNPGGKFVPHGLASDLGVKAETVSQWKRILEDAMLVQQLAPLKPSLSPANGKDKAYLLDPGWHAYFAGVIDASEIMSQPVAGLLAETVLADHARRLQATVTGSRSFTIGYVEKPEVDVAADLGGRWLLLEAKYRAQPKARLDEVDAPAGSVRIVATRDHFEVPDGREGTAFLPAHEVALLA